MLEMDRKPERKSNKSKTESGLQKLQETNPKKNKQMSREKQR